MLMASALARWALPGIYAKEPTSDPKLVEDVNTVLVGTSFSLTRQLALIEVDHPELIRTLARHEPDLELRRIATLLLTDQADLKEQAVARDAVIREAAVACLTDEAFLVHRLLSREEPSPAVRRAMIWALRTQDSLAQVAQTAYDREVREAATKRVTDVDLSARVRTAQEAIECEEMATAGGGAPGGLVHQALAGPFDVLRVAAAKRLRSPEELAAVALAAGDRTVLKIVLGRLKDQSVLKKVAAEAADPGVRLAAAFRTGSQRLDDLIKEAKALDEAESKAGGREGEAEKATAAASNVVAALWLSGEILPSATEAVRWAFGRMIRKRDEARIQEMVDLIALYDDRELARMASDSSQPDLEDAGNAWFKANGIGFKPRLGGKPDAVAANEEKDDS